MPIAYLFGHTFCISLGQDPSDLPTIRVSIHRVFLVRPEQGEYGWRDQSFLSFLNGTLLDLGQCLETRRFALSKFHI